MSAVRITDHGAVGDGAQDDSAAFLAAVAACAAGDELVIPRPPVRWMASGIVIDKQLRIVGEGYEPEIRRNGGNLVFDVATSDGVVFENLALDCFADANFRSCVKADGHGHIRISDCALRTSVVPTDGWTIMGVLARGCSDLVIERNRLDGAQIKAGGPTVSGATNGPGIRIRNNFGVNCHNFGVSVVGVAGAGHVSDVSIEGNTFLDCHNGCIYVGADGDGTKLTEMRRVSILGNTVSTDYAAATAIQVRGGAVWEDVDVSHNHAYPSAALGGAGRYAVGLSLKQTDDPTEGVARRVRAIGNMIRGSDKWAIRALVRGGEVSLIGNQTHDDQGMIVHCTAGQLDLTASGNIAKPRSTYKGLTLQASAGASIDAALSANRIGNGMAIAEADAGSVKVY